MVFFNSFNLAVQVHNTPSFTHTYTHKHTQSNPHFHTYWSWLFAYFLCLEEQVDFLSSFENQKSKTQH